MATSFRTFRARLAFAVICLSTTLAWAAEAVTFDRTEDVVYGRKYGVALTLDVFKPKTGANGAAVVWVVSGGWFSSHEAISPKVFSVLLGRGYTVFAVVHGSNPKFTLPEVVEDMHRSIRFIRHNAAKYEIDPNRIGITGGSAGGHLSLMMGTAGCAGNPKAKDPVNTESSRVQAVGCFFPPTDFMNYGEPGRDVFKALEGELRPFQAPFDFVELDEKTGRFVPIADPERRMQIARNVSPITHVSPDDPPTLILHGDADKLVPIQQSQTFGKKMEEAGVPFKLVVKAGEKHGWKDWTADMATIADWFDKYLIPARTATQPH